MNDNSYVIKISDSSQKQMLKMMLFKRALKTPEKLIGIVIWKAVDFDFWIMFLSDWWTEVTFDCEHKRG